MPIVKIVKRVEICLPVWFFCCQYLFENIIIFIIKNLLNVTESKFFFFDLFIQNSFMLQWIQKYTDTLCEYCLIRWSNRFFFILQIMQHSKIGTKRNALCLRERENKEKLKITYIQTNGKNYFDFFTQCFFFFFWKNNRLHRILIIDL